MSENSLSALAMVHASPDRVRAAIADYREVRPAILPPNFSDYQVLQGGQGAGTRARWRLTPGRWNKRKSREWEVLVEESGDALLDRDTRSGTVITWTVLGAPDGRSAVQVQLSWEGPGGLAGVHARSRSGRLLKVYGDMLLQLRDQFPPGDGGPSPAEPEPSGVEPTGETG